MRAPTVFCSLPQKFLTRRDPEFSTMLELLVGRGLAPALHGSRESKQDLLPAFSFGDVGAKEKANKKKSAV